jgi:hypothetical protein
VEFLHFGVLRVQREGEEREDDEATHRAI